MSDLISLQATPLATTRHVVFQLRRDTSGIQKQLNLLDSGFRRNIVNLI
jgi:hypothetical protein